MRARALYKYYLQNLKKAKSRDLILCSFFMRVRDQGAGSDNAFILLTIKNERVPD